jgi:hypothetical protein
MEKKKERKKRGNRKTPPIDCSTYLLESVLQVAICFASETDFSYESTSSRAFSLASEPEAARGGAP